MNAFATTGLVGAVALIAGVAVGYEVFSQNPRLPATCANVESNAVYGVQLAYATGAANFALGVVHLPPGGFKHNVALSYDNTSQDDRESATFYNLSKCTDNNGSGPATMNMLDANTGSRDGVLTFTDTPADANAAFGVTVTSSSPGVPNMSGNAYIMK